MTSPVPAAARTRWYSTLAALTNPSGVAVPDHIGGIAMRFRSVSPANDNGDNSVGIRLLESRIPDPSPLAPIGWGISAPAAR